jgi:hypothetical protein
VEDISGGAFRLDGVVGTRELLQDQRRLLEMICQTRHRMEFPSYTDDYKGNRTIEAVVSDRQAPIACTRLSSSVGHCRVGYYNRKCK